MRGLTVVGGAIVPVLVNVDLSNIEYVTTAISLSVVILVSLEAVLHYREQWKNYRSTEQYLGHELVYFQNRAGAYRELGDREAFELFVDRVESAIASENAATLNTMTLGQQVTEEQVGVFAQRRADYKEPGRGVEQFGILERLPRMARARDTVDRRVLAA
jgi:hypothetical protein